MKRKKNIEHMINHSEMIPSVMAKTGFNRQTCTVIVKAYLETLLTKMVEAKPSTEIMIPSIGRIRVYKKEARVVNLLNRKTGQIEPVPIKAHPQYNLKITQKSTKQIAEKWRYHNGIV